MRKGGLEQVVDGLSTTPLPPFKQERKQPKVKQPKKQPKVGENHPRAKLTVENVRAIKRRLKNSEPPTNLAAKFGVSLATIYDIKLGRSWKGVGE